MATETPVYIANANSDEVFDQLPITPVLVLVPVETWLETSIKGNSEGHLRNPLVFALCRVDNPVKELRKRNADCLCCFWQ